MWNICKQNFISSFPIWKTFISFYSLITVAKTSKPMLNNIGESGHPCLVPDLRKNDFSFSPLRIMFALDLSYMVFILLRYVPSMPTFWRVFFFLIINECWILLKAFSASIEMIMWFLSFSLLIYYITLIDLCILKNSCILGIKPTWSWCIIFLMYFWTLFPGILLRTLASVFISDTSMWFFCGLSCFGIRMMVA